MRSVYGCATAGNIENRKLLLTSDALIVDPISPGDVPTIDHLIRPSAGPFGNDDRLLAVGSVERGEPDLHVQLGSEPGHVPVPTRRRRVDGLHEPRHDFVQRPRKERMRRLMAMVRA